jgi:hypothetical protein
LAASDSSATTLTGGIQIRPRQQFRAVAPQEFDARQQWRYIAHIELFGIHGKYQTA